MADTDLREPTGGVPRAGAAMPRRLVPPVPAPAGSAGVRPGVFRVIGRVLAAELTVFEFAAVLAGVGSVLAAVRITRVVVTRGMSGKRRKRGLA
ncbi:hypothetical protein NONO_c19030 [Nocardia nova SH22a]|uniref:Transmembrane protein n=1 Tax=Nocardia nova SH22a TaxID=1415166 RepID=W5TCJ0_9NOCA|nr:hypothetical protein [Nocardia nova]AHH16703.1 hypothetical protein NONO_c19030 [Nocardia nova SH22a]